MPRHDELQREPVPLRLCAEQTDSSRDRPRHRVLPQRLWPGYKTGEGIERALPAQFHPLEEALRRWAWPSGRWSSSRRTTRWPGGAARGGGRAGGAGVHLGQRQGLASASGRSGGPGGPPGEGDPRRGRRAREVRGGAGADPRPAGAGRRPQDGYPGIAGIGKATAARLLGSTARSRPSLPSVLGEQREQALLFKELATLRADAPLFRDVEEVRWRGPTDAFAGWADRIGDPRLLNRVTSLSG